MRLLLALAAFPLPALGQFFDVAALDVPIQPDRTPLAASVDVPFPLLLGLDGATPLFVNPARAARTDHRFVFGTVNRPDAIRTPVSVAALVGARDGRWLVTASNAVGTQDAVNMDTRSSREDFDPDRTVITETESRNELSVADVDTRARIAFVGRTDYGGYAVGLFGGYRTDSRVRRTTTDAMFFSERIFSTHTDTRTDERMITDVADSKHADYGVGAEVAFAGRRWDAVASLSYQGRTADDEVSTRLTERNDAVQDYDDGQQFATFRRLTRETDISLKGHPSGIALEALGTLRTTRHRDDYLFGAVSGLYAGGDADVALRIDEVQTIRTETDGTGTEEETTIFDEASGTGDLDTQITEVALGYVYARRQRDLIVLAGVAPSGRIERRDFVNTAATYDLVARRIETDALTLALDLPLHVQVPVSRTLALFGGGVYRYQYRDLTTTQRPLDTTSTLPGSPIEEEQANEIEQQSVSSSSRLYGGAIFWLRSGFTAQAAFRGDFAQFAGWTVSLGYRF